MAIGPNKTAPASLRRVGPNGSFPIGDANHDRMALSGATRSMHAGNISPATARRIKAAAAADLRTHGGDSVTGSRTYNKMNQRRPAGPAYKPSGAIGMGMLKG